MKISQRLGGAGNGRRGAGGEAGATKQLGKVSRKGDHSQEGGGPRLDNRAQSRGEGARGL